VTAPAADAAASAPRLLTVRDLRVRYDGAPAPAPDGASLEVRPGEVVLVLGPSGSGKSTLALTTNGLVPQSLPAHVEGEVRTAGLDAARTPVPELSTRVGMVFQDPDAQLVTGTVFDEVAFGPENLLLPIEVVRGRTEAALRRVGLWDRRDDDPARLSGGGRQRLAIAAALALDAPLLVLDEPTATLDPSGVTEVYAAIADAVADGTRGVLLVEHDLDAAIGVAHRVVVLDSAGRTIADGTADEVLRGRAEELHAIGVWLPTPTLAALRLRRAGYRLDPLPLTAAELRAGLENEPAPAASVIPSAPRDAAAGAPAPPAVRVRALSVALGRGRDRRTVLHEADLDVAAGAFVAIVGGNGAGKTTLVQAIAGVRRPPRGTVVTGGVDVARADPRRLAAHVGFVFQNPEHQFVTTTVFDEVAYGLRRQCLPDAVVRARTLDALERFGLTAHAQTHPFLLSGGQKRRLSVATALVTAPPVLVLDEPTFGQDRARAEALLSMLGEVRAAGTSVLVVSHDMQLVAEHADRVVALRDGRVVADAAPAALFADEAALEMAGLRAPTLQRAFAALTRHPALRDATRLADLPGGDG
jgi:energy-coupling factor transport system ATP-binding protein